MSFEDEGQDAVAIDEGDAGVKKQRKPRFKKVEHDYPVEPRVIQIVKKPKTFTDHSYRDFSNVPADLNFQAPSSIEEMSFSEKLYDILSKEEYSNWIQWLPHGRAFKITVPKSLEQSRLLQKYFGHNRYSSFLRQVNNHGFKHITKGVDRNCYYHECFLRGMKHLLKYMPPARDARRLMPDPDNEPDLYAVARVYPLPHENQRQQNDLKETAPSNNRISALQAPLLQSLNFPILAQPPAALPLGLSSIQTIQKTQVQLQALQLQQHAALLQQQALQQKAAALLGGSLPGTNVPLLRMMDSCQRLPWDLGQGSLGI